MTIEIRNDLLQMVPTTPSSTAPLNENSLIQASLSCLCTIVCEYLVPNKDDVNSIWETSVAVHRWSRSSSIDPRFELAQTIARVDELSQFLQKPVPQFVLTLLDTPYSFPDIGKKDLVLRKELDGLALRKKRELSSKEFPELSLNNFPRSTTIPAVVEKDSRDTHYRFFPYEQKYRIPGRKIQFMLPTCHEVTLIINKKLSQNIFPYSFQAGDSAQFYEQRDDSYEWRITRDIDANTCISLIFSVNQLAGFLNSGRCTTAPTVLSLKATPSRLIKEAFTCREKCHFGMDRNAAEERLKNNTVPNGSWILRPSSQPPMNAISYKNIADGVIEHFLQGDEDCELLLQWAKFDATQGCIKP